MELAASVARKELEYMKASAMKSFRDSGITLIQNSIGTINGQRNSAEHQIQKLNEELQNLEQQLNGVTARNQDAAKKVVLYENPELEDAMQERIQIALDHKERQLQAELLRQLEQRAIEMDAEKHRSLEGIPGGVLNTPAKIDFFGDNARLENEYNQLENERIAKDNELKFVSSKHQQVREKLQATNAQLAALKREVGDLHQQNTLMKEEISGLHNDTNKDERIKD